MLKFFHIYFWKAYRNIPPKVISKFMFSLILCELIYCNLLTLFENHLGDFFVMLNGQFALSCFSMRFNVFGGPLMSFFFINSYFVKFLSHFFTFLFLRCELSWMIPISECIRSINALTLLSQSSFSFLPYHINFVV